WCVIFAESFSNGGVVAQKAKNREAEKAQSFFILILEIFRLYPKNAGKSPSLRLRQRHGERVGGVVGLGHGRKSQKAGDHELHLLLGRLSVTGERLFDLVGGIFEDMSELMRGAEENDSS